MSHRGVIGESVINNKTVENLETLFQLAEAKAFEIKVDKRMAKKFYEQALELDPDNKEVKNKLGELKLK